MIEFLGIGTQKAGTTWLTTNLRSHPQVWIPRVVKEIHYFDVVHLGYNRNFMQNKLEERCAHLIKKMQKSGVVTSENEQYLKRIVDHDFAFTDEWYEHIFSAAPKGKMRGEFTPFYCALDSKGIDHVKRLMPKVKLIYMIRDPMQRAMSAMRMILERKGKRSQKEILENPLFQARGDYALNVPAWEKAFSKDQILYLPFGGIKTDPISIMRKVETFLGVSPLANYPKLKEQINPTVKDKIEIDSESMAMIEEMTASQYPFLEAHFGGDFVAQIS